MPLWNYLNPTCCAQKLSLKTDQNPVRSPPRGQTQLSCGASSVATEQVNASHVPWFRNRAQRSVPGGVGAHATLSAPVREDLHFTLTGLPYGGRTARRCDLGRGPSSPAPEATLCPLGPATSLPRASSAWQSLTHRHQSSPAAPTCTSCSAEGETSISFRVTPKLPFRLVSLTCCCSKGTRYRNVSSTPRIRRVGCSSSTGTSKPREAVARSRRV